jgi:hypothetical protein
MAITQTMQTRRPTARIGRDEYMRASIAQHGGMFQSVVPMALSTRSMD